MYEKMFRVDNITYLFRVIDNCISFSIIKGSSKKGIFSSFVGLNGESDDEHGDLNISISPWKVLDKVTELTLGYIRKYKPYVFSFSTDSDRKAKVYKYLIKKVFKKNPDIRRNYSSNYGLGRSFIFYKKPKKMTY